MKILATKLLGVLVSTFVFSSYTLANSSKNVIYTTNGSVLKGTIIEQDFKNGRYQIQLNNGQVVTLKKPEISRIKKDNQITNLQVTPPTVSAQRSAPIYSTPTAKKRLTKPSEFTLGYLHHTIQYDRNPFYNTSPKESFNGVRIGYVKPLRRLLTFRSDLEFAVEDHETSIFDIDEKQYVGLSASLTAGRRFNSGFEMFAGPGIFIHNYIMEGDDDGDLGTMASAGFGFNWRKFSAKLAAKRYLILGSDTQIDKVYGVTFNFGAQL